MKKVLVYGLGVSGISAVKTLSKMGYETYTYDKNKIYLDELKGYNYSPISDLDIDKEDFDFVVKSPGIKPNDDLLMKLSKKSQILSDIELAYRLFPNKEFLAITGTNGKTSTTSMVAHILNEAGKKASSVGNIGEGVLWKMYQEDAVFVEELSSFQLYNTYEFHPHIAAILNITPDHLDWHRDFDDYKNSKLNIARNQNENDFLILNANDKILQSYKKEAKAKVYEFSANSQVDLGMYLSGKDIIFKDGEYVEKIINVDQLKIIGNHNYENIMAAMLIAYLYGISFEKILIGAKTYQSIEHRLEFVDRINDVDIYNDSKATNVDSAIKAIESFSKPIIIIAGGYDKKIDYSDYVKAFKKNGKLMIIMGETKAQLEKLCIENRVNYLLADDMEMAVKLCFDNANSGDVILLSPASASWDMYKSYEVRGRDFKEKIEKYKGLSKWE